MFNSTSQRHTLVSTIQRNGVLARSLKRIYKPTASYETRFVVRKQNHILLIIAIHHTVCSDMFLRLFPTGDRMDLYLNFFLSDFIDHIVFVFNANAFTVSSA